jgi:dipeptidyl aminopeptidase/acylaminoacyl peptidase
MRRAWVALLVLLALPSAIALQSAWRQHRRMHPTREPEPLSVARAVLANAEAVSFSTSDGVRLDGWYAPGRNGFAVVLAGGVLARRSELLGEAGLLAQAGFGVLLFDWRAHGSSGGERSTWGDLERDDLRAAIAFAASRPDVAQGRVGLYGFSMGGAVAALVASEEPRVGAVAIAGTYPTLEETTRQDLGRWGAWSGLPAVWTLRLEGVHVDEVRPIDRLCRLAPRPLLILDGGEDPSRVQRQTERMVAAACEPRASHVVPHAGHGAWLRAGDPDYSALLLAHFGRMAQRP